MDIGRHPELVLRRPGKLRTQVNWIAGRAAARERKGSERWLMFTRIEAD